MSTARVRRANGLMLAVWLLALIGAALVIWQTRFSADLSAFLPAAPDARQRVLIEQLQAGTSARTLVLAVTGGQASQRAKASHDLAVDLRASGQFEQVLNGDQAALAAIGEWVFAHRYQISPGISADRFTVAGLRDAIDDSLSLLGTPAGSALKPILTRDPTGEVLRISEQSLGQAGPRSADGVWVSRDGQMALLLTYSRAEGADLNAQAAAIATVNGAFSRIAPAGLELLLSGTPKFGVDSRTMIEREVRWLAIVGSVLMGLLLLLAFGSVRAVAAAALPVVSGVLAGIAAVSLGFGSVHGITLGFGTTLIGEAVDYAVYYLIQTPGTKESMGESGWRHWARHGWPTVRLGMLTSCCGFLALAFSGFPGLAQLGVYSTAGLVAAALTTRYVLPILLPNGAPAATTRTRMAAWAGAAMRALPRWRHAFSALGLASVCVLAWQHDRLWRADLSSLSPVAPQALALDARLRAELLAGSGSGMVVVQAESVEAVLQATEAVGKRLDAMVDAGDIGGYESVARILPSLATQAVRRQALPSADVLRPALAEATRLGPLPAARLGPFIDDVESSRSLPALQFDALGGSPVAPLVNNLLVRRPSGTWLSLMPIRAAGSKALQPNTVQATLLGIAQAQWIDIGDELGQLYQHYLSEAQAQALLGGVGVLALIALSLRSWRRLFWVGLPLVQSVILTMAGLTLLGVPLGILHLVGLLLVVAVGSNYALFFDLLRTEPSPDEKTIWSLLLANLTTVLSFGLIAFSQIPALSAIGRVVSLGALLALLLTAAYAPSSSAQRPATADAV